MTTRQEAIAKEIKTLTDIQISDALKPYGCDSIQGFDHIKAFARTIESLVLEQMEKQQKATTKLKEALRDCKVVLAINDAHVPTSVTEAISALDAVKEPVAYFDNNGKIVGRVSDEQLEALCLNALHEIETRTGQVKEPEPVARVDDLERGGRVLALAMGLALDAPLYIALPMQKESEPVYAFRRKGQDSFCTCDKARYLELSYKPNLFETTILYTAPPISEVKK